MAVGPDSRQVMGPDGGGRSDQLVIEVDRRPEQLAATIRVHGEIDVATAPALQGKLEAMLRDGVRRLVLDLAGVEFCDVAGLNLLLRMESELAARDDHLTVLAPCRPLRIMVSVLGLEGQLSLSLADAGDLVRMHDQQAGA